MNNNFEPPAQPESKVVTLFGGPSDGLQMRIPVGEYKVAVPAGRHYIAKHGKPARFEHDHHIYIQNPNNLEQFDYAGTETY